MTDTPETLTERPNQEQRELEALVARFEEAWFRGEQPAITAFLLPGKDKVLVELVHTDLACRLKAGGQARVETYLERFPALRQDPAQVLDLIQFEYECRRRREPDLNPGEYARRFPQFENELPGRLQPSAVSNTVNALAGAATSPPVAPSSAGPASPRGPDRVLRCPRCHVPLPDSGPGSAARFTCPSCGGHCDVVDSGRSTSGDAVIRRLDRFELMEALGAGSFGQVWKAHDTRLNRFVAIKVPHRDRLSPLEVGKFLREARVAAGIKHPGIVSVHEVGQAEETFYIVSEFIEGESLAARLGRQPLTYREAAELCLQVAEALHYAHEAGVIHRDLKPANLLLDRVGRPHITDFGLAKRELGEITMTFEGQILGTPAYMSPEQACGRGHHADRRSDVYSLGVILFELLSNERPFRGNLQALLQQVIRDEAPSPRKFDALIPADLERICLQCLGKEPGDRYPTAQALAQDLRCWLRGAAVPAAARGRLRQAARWVRHQPLTAALAGTVLGLLIVIGILVGRASPNRPTENDDGEISPADLAKSGAEGTAAVIKKDEQEAKKRIAAVRYLGTVDAHFRPETAAALISALRGDHNEEVRLEAALALGKGNCITRETIAALRITIAGTDPDQNPGETSERVKAAARKALDYALKHFKEPKPPKNPTKDREKV
jgi:hypothetical protein